MSAQENSQGKLIVIDGGDGSGKHTQAQLLIEHFQKENLPVNLMDFPQYDTFYGQMVAQFLRGEFGAIDQVSPYLASLLYALDRAGVKDNIRTFLNNNEYVISDRYTTSSIAHQAAKFSDRKERETFINWIEKLEYQIHGLPKEDIVIYLYVPWQIAKKLTQNKPNREYLNGEKEDIHEKDDNYRMQTEKMYLELAQKNPHWVKIDCVVNGEMLAVQEIHKRIVQTLYERSIINK